jgi:hypothetical protein
MRHEMTPGGWSPSHCGDAVWGACHGSACGGVRCGLSGKAELIPTALEPLKHIAALLNLPEFKERRVHVEGHTDATGTTKLNQELSEARAARAAA